MPRDVLWCQIQVVARGSGDRLLLVDFFFHLLSGKCFSSKLDRLYV